MSFAQQFGKGLMTSARNQGKRRFGQMSADVFHGKPTHSSTSSPIQVPQWNPSVSRGRTAKPQVFETRMTHTPRSNAPSYPGHGLPGWEAQQFGSGFRRETRYRPVQTQSPVPIQHPAPTQPPAPSMPGVLQGTGPSASQTATQSGDGGSQALKATGDWSRFVLILSALVSVGSAVADVMAKRDPELKKDPAFTTLRVALQGFDLLGQFNPVSAAINLGRALDSLFDFLPETQASSEQWDAELVVKVTKVRTAVTEIATQLQALASQQPAPAEEKAPADADADAADAPEVSADLAAQATRVLSTAEQAKKYLDVLARTVETVAGKKVEAFATGAHLGARMVKNRELFSHGGNISLATSQSTLKNEAWKEPSLEKGSAVLSDSVASMLPATKDYAGADNSKHRARSSHLYPGMLDSPFG